MFSIFKFDFKLSFTKPFIIPLIGETLLKSKPFATTIYLSFGEIPLEISKPTQPKFLI